MEKPTIVTMLLFRCLQKSRRLRCWDEIRWQWRDGSFSKQGFRNSANSWMIKPTVNFLLPWQKYSQQTKLKGNRKSKKHQELLCLTIFWHVCPKSDVFYEWYGPGTCPVKQLMHHKGVASSFHIKTVTSRLCQHNLRQSWFNSLYKPH